MYHHIFNESALIWQEIMSVDGGKATADIAFSNKKSNPLKEFVREKNSWYLKISLLFNVGTDWRTKS